MLNPIASEYPTDFRTVDQILRQETEDLDIKNPNTESVRKTMKKAIQMSQLDARNGSLGGWVKPLVLVQSPRYGHAKWRYVGFKRGLRTILTRLESIRVLSHYGHICCH